MPTITIITTYGAVSVEGSHWARDKNGAGDLHVYRTDEDGDDESVASVDADRYVAVAETDGLLEGSELEVEISAEEFANRLEEKTPPS